MKNLKIRQKLLLLGALFMLPFAVATYRVVSSINTLGIEFAQQEVRGVDYYEALLPLLKDLQQHRGLAGAWLGGDAAFKDRVAQKAADIENDLQRVDEVDARLATALHTHEQWAAVSAACRDLLARTAGLSAEDSFGQHRKLIEDLIALITAVGDASKLTLDPDIDSYYLMNVVIFQGPQLSELLAQARGLGSTLAAGGRGHSAQFERLKELSVLAEFLRTGTRESLDKALAYNAALKSQLEAPTQSAMQTVEDAATTLGQRAAGRKLGLDAAAYYAEMTRSIDALFELEERAAASLRQLLQQRIAKFRRELASTLALAALGLLVLSIVGWLIMRDIVDNLRRVIGVADQIAAGDLSAQTDTVQRRDEIGELNRAFDHMVAALRTTVQYARQVAGGDLSVAIQPQSERDEMGNALANMVRSLAALVGEVHKSGIQVNSSVTKIAATAREQQTTATEIAATTTEIGATSREITATSRELVRTMDEVATVAEQSATLAGSGQAGLAHMEETMHGVMAAAGTINAKLAVLNEKASNINQVVTTITKVADQTNLLSLNAAIEAEKAGEYGRGFSVVATEIRRLADQTAVATYDIEQMIKEIQSAVSAGVMGMDKFSDEVRRGMQDVQQVSGQLNQIIQQVQALAPRVDSVNEGMQAQATGAEQITQALTQLTEAAQQTVESLRQSNIAMEGLNQVSTGLRSGVSRFKLEA